MMGLSAVINCSERKNIVTLLEDIFPLLGGHYNVKSKLKRILREACKCPKSSKGAHLGDTNMPKLLHGSRCKLWEQHFLAAETTPLNRTNGVQIVQDNCALEIWAAGL